VSRQQLARFQFNTPLEVPMPADKSKPSAAAKSPPLLITLLSLASLVGIALTIAFVANRFESLEDQLRFTPHPGQGAALTTDWLEVVDRQKVYVPVYSHIYSNEGSPILLAATLSVRNTDPKRAIKVASVRYYDTKGTLLREYVSEGLVLQPLESANFLVESSDVEGGSGANFLVEWGAEEPVYEPVIEAVMVGFTNQQSVSFVSPGRPLAESD
jgi:hypothetical protein